MPSIVTDDGVRLHCEVAGDGDPILFMHEFGGHHLSWEPQMRYFARHYRCIVYAARGWPPSDVPDRVEDYSQDRAAADAVAVLDGLGIAQAHLVGLSMGATAGLEAAIRYPDRVLSLTFAGGGSGGAGDAAARQKFREDCAGFATRLESEGMAAMAELYCAGPARVQFRRKDPRGWAAFKDEFAAGSARGHALTMLGVQAARLPFFDRAAELATLTAPVLVVVGDEDPGTIDLALFLKRTLRRCGIAMLPNTGHTMNLEEPAAFNAAVQDFIHSVERGGWTGREPEAREDYLLVPRTSGG